MECAAMRRTGKYFGSGTRRIRRSTGLGNRPFTPGPSVEDFRTIELLPEVGVILLMYSIGLEFSSDELLRVRWVAGIGTPVAMLLSIGSGVPLHISSTADETQTTLCT